MTPIQPLPWDSELFGFGVGRTDAPFESADALISALDRAADAGMRIVYGFGRPGDARSDAIAAAAGGQVFDRKRTYSAALVGAAGPQILELAADDPCSRRQLRSLAWQAAEHSRFRIDLRLPAGGWRRMYSLWIGNSLNGTLADAVAVELYCGRIVGMVTVSHRQARGEIGLLAVDRGARGRGVGRRLVREARNSCLAAGCHSLSVVTQGNNAAACGLYEAEGFELSAEQNIFHFWNEPR